MKPDAKKVVAKAKVEGHQKLWTIKCDLFYLPNGHPVAVLDWGSDMALLDGQCAPLRPELLQPSLLRGIALEYRNVQEPIQIPKELADWHPNPSSSDGLFEFLRKGFLRLD